MKLNRALITELQKKNDRELWETVRKIALEHGYNLPEATPRTEDIAKIREILSGGGKFSYSDALKILNNYKKGGH